MGRWLLSDFADALDALAVPAGEAVLVHSSLVALGPSRDVPPRDLPAALLDVCRAHFGRESTIVVPTFTFAFCRGVPFDVSASPSERMGSFTEYVRIQPESLRSPHPMQSFAAIGPLARHLTEPDTPAAFAIGGSVDRLLEADATLLLIGASVQHAALVHWSEQRAEVPYRFMKSFRGGWRRSPDEVFVEREYALFARDLDLDEAFDLSVIADGLGVHLRRAEVGAGYVQACSSGPVRRDNRQAACRRPLGIGGCSSGENSVTPEIANRVLALTSTFVKTGVELDVDLVGSGIMDSLAFLELVAALESEFNVDALDFAELDPERFTTPRGLIEALEVSCV